MSETFDSRSTDNTDHERNVRPKHRPAVAPRRPLGITILVVLLIVGALGSVIELIASQYAGSVMETRQTVSTTDQVDQTNMQQEFAALSKDFEAQIIREQQSQAFWQLWIYGLSIPLNLVAAVGLWRLKSWARQLLLVLSGVTVVGALVVGTSRLSAIVSFMIVIYLLQPHVRAAFDQTHATRHARFLR